MTDSWGLLYCPWLVDGWQSKAAFVIQFREGTDIEGGRLEGKVEHIASYRAARFHSVEDLLAFMGRILADVKRGGSGEGPCGPEKEQE